MLNLVKITPDCYFLLVLVRSGLIVRQWTEGSSYVMLSLLIMIIPLFKKKGEFDIHPVHITSCHLGPFLCTPLIAVLEVSPFVCLFGYLS